MWKKSENLEIFEIFWKILFHLKLIFMNEFNREYSEIVSILSQVNYF